MVRTTTSKRLWDWIGHDESIFISVWKIVHLTFIRSASCFILIFVFGKMQINLHIGFLKIILENYEHYFLNLINLC